MKKSFFICFFTLILIAAACSKNKSSGNKNNGDSGYDPVENPNQISCQTPLQSEAVADYIENTVSDYCVYDFECHSEGIGQKACGGPVSYITFSTRVVDNQSYYKLNNLYQAISYYNWLTEYENDICSLVSTCEYQIAPGGPQCINHKCQTVYY